MFEWSIVVEDEKAEEEEEKSPVRPPRKSSKPKQESAGDTPKKVLFWNVQDLQTLLECLEAGHERVRKNNVFDNMMRN